MSHEIGQGMLLIFVREMSHLLIKWKNDRMAAVLLCWFGFNQASKSVDDKGAKSKPVKQEISHIMILHLKK